MQIQLVLIYFILNIIIPTAISIDDISSEQIIDIPDDCKSEFRISNWKDCANSLSTLIWNTHSWYDNHPITICKLKCTRKLKGHISNFQWVWDAKFGCGEQTPEIIGEARGFELRQHAMEHAISEAIEKSITFDKLTPNDFIC